MTARAEEARHSAPEPLVQRAGEPAELLIRDAHLLDPTSGIDRQADVMVRGGLIEEIAEPGSLEPGDVAEVIEAAGLHLFPAFFDPHVHLRTPGQEYKEDLETGTRAAAAGGYGGILAMANTAPPVSDPGDLEALRHRAGLEAVVPVGFLATLTRGMEGRDLVDMSELREVGAVGFTDDGLPVADAGVLARALRYQKMCGGTIALHEEDPTLSGAGVMNEGAISTRLGLRGIPSTSETVMIMRDTAIAGYEGGRIQVQHLSAAGSVEAVRRAKADGVDVHAEVTPHHLCLTDEEVVDLDASRHKMNPPLRTEADRLALIGGLLDGTIDCIATDHAPHALHEKEVPFEEAAMGVTGLETAFAALFTHLVVPGAVPLEVIVEKLGSGGRAFGIEAFGLTVGETANFCLVDLGASWVVGKDGYESRSSNSWCSGDELTGRVLTTVANGQVAWRLRSFTLEVA